MFELIDVNTLGVDKRKKLLLELYERIIPTYVDYFERYKKSRWSFKKFESKTMIEYPLGFISSEDGEVSFYKAISYPRRIENENFLKIGFWVYGSRIEKTRSQTLKSAIEFSEKKLQKLFPPVNLIIELPKDYEKIISLYNSLGFIPNKDEEKVEELLKAFGSELVDIRTENEIPIYTTKNTKNFYQMLLSKKL